MKYTHTCPKCRSTDAVRVPGRSGAYGSGNNISVGFSTFNAVLVTRYVCLACGFVEEWIDRPQDLDKLRAKFGQPANPR